MFLLLQNSNLLLGGIPELVGLLLFGVALVAMTVCLRWLLSENKCEEIVIQDKSNHIQ